MIIRILIVQGKTKWADLTGDGLDSALEGLLQYFMDNLVPLDDFEIWLIKDIGVVYKYNLLKFAEQYHIRKRSFEERLQCVYTGKHINFNLMKFATGYIYKEAKENLGSIYGSCQKGVDNNDSI